MGAPLVLYSPAVSFGVQWDSGMSVLRVCFGSLLGFVVLLCMGGRSPASLFYTWRAARSRIVFGFQDCVGIAVGLLIADFCAVLYGSLMGRRGLH